VIDSDTLREGLRRVCAPQAVRTHLPPSPPLPDHRRLGGDPDAESGGVSVRVFGAEAGTIRLTTSDQGWQYPYAPLVSPPTEETFSCAISPPPCSPGPPALPLRLRLRARKLRRPKQAGALKHPRVPPSSRCRSAPTKARGWMWTCRPMGRRWPSRCSVTFTPCRFRAARPNGLPMALHGTCTRASPPMARASPSPRIAAAGTISG